MSFALLEKGLPMNKQYIEAALALARLYGIAETLHPWDYLENDKFVERIQAWTDEFLSADGTDLVSFFESKIQAD